MFYQANTIVHHQIVSPSFFQLSVFNVQWENQQDTVNCLLQQHMTIPPTSHITPHQDLLSSWDSLLAMKSGLHSLLQLRFVFHVGKRNVLLHLWDICVEEAALWTQPLQAWPVPDLSYTNPYQHFKIFVTNNSHRTVICSGLTCDPQPPILKPQHTILWQLSNFWANLKLTSLRNTTNCVLSRLVLGPALTFTYVLLFFQIQCQAKQAK